MKFWDLFLAVFIFNLVGTAMASSGMFAAMGMTSYQTIGSVEETSDIVAEIQNATQGSVVTEISPIDPDEAGLSWVYRVVANSVSSFFTPLRHFIFFPAIMMSSFGIPNEFGYMVTIIFDMILAVGILQFVTGRGIRDYE